MDRRDFLRGTAVGIPLQAAAMQVPAPQYTGKPELKITDIQAFLVNVGHNYVYVKVSPDQGIHGWGEAYPGGPDAAVMANVLDFKDWLVGKDPRNIEYLWATMYNFSRFPGGLVVNAAISGSSVIMITGNQGARHKIYAESLGVDVYLNKPFRMDQLVEEAERLLAK